MPSQTTATGWHHRTSSDVNVVISRVFGRWFPSRVPVAAARLGHCLINSKRAGLAQIGVTHRDTVDDGPSQRTTESYSTVCITVEAAGSGTVLIPTLDVNAASTTVQQLRETIYRTLGMENGCRLFFGHGGVEISRGRSAFAAMLPRSGMLLLNVLSSLSPSSLFPSTGSKHHVDVGDGVATSSTADYLSPPRETGAQSTAAPSRQRRRQVTLVVVPTPPPPRTSTAVAARLKTDRSCRSAKDALVVCNGTVLALIDCVIGGLHLWGLVAGEDEKQHETKYILRNRIVRYVPRTVVREGGCMRRPANRSSIFAPFVCLWGVVLERACSALQVNGEGSFETCASWRGIR